MNNQNYLKQLNKGISIPIAILIIVILAGLAGGIIWQYNKTVKKAMSLKEKETPQLGGQKEEAGGKEKIKIITTIPPLYSLAVNIATDQMEIENLVPPGIDIASFQPTPDDIEKVSQADVLIAVGLSFEEFLDEMLKKANNPNLKIIHVGEELPGINYSEKSKDDFTIRNNQYISNSLGVSFVNLGRFPVYYKFLPNKPSLSMKENTFWYRGLVVSLIDKEELEKEGYNIWPLSSSVHSINFDCNGSLAPGATWRNCETNHKDFLTQYEFTSVVDFYFTGEAPGPTFSESWHKLYIKLIDDTYIIAYGNLQPNAPSNAERDLQKLIEKNAPKIEDWNKIVSSIQLIQKKKEGISARFINPYIWLYPIEAIHICSSIRDALIKVECERKGGEPDNLTLNIGDMGTVKEEICNLSNKKFIENISWEKHLQVEDTVYPEKAFEEEHKNGDFYYFKESKVHNNYSSYLKKLDQLDKDLEAELDEIRDKDFIVADYSLNWLLDYYVPSQPRAVIKETRNEPELKPFEINQLTTFIRNQGIRILFTRPYSLEDLIATLKNELEIEVYEIDPVDVELQPKGYENALREISQTIIQAFSE